MARKRDLAGKLSGDTNPAPRPGWRDTIGPPPAQVPQRGESVPVHASRTAGHGKQEESEENPNKLKRKTYLLTQDLIERIATLADEERVGINELVRFLLTEAVIAIENGDMEIPTEPAKRQISGQ